MKTPLHHLHRTRASRVPLSDRLRRGVSPTSRWRAAIVVTASTGWLAAVCGAQEITAEPCASSPLPSVPWSPEGKQLLAVTLGLFVALILMERFCAWGLRVQRRRAQVASRALREALPSASFGLVPRRHGRMRVRGHIF